MLWPAAIPSYGRWWAGSWTDETVEARAGVGRVRAGRSRGRDRPVRLGMGSYIVAVLGAGSSGVGADPGPTFGLGAGQYVRIAGRVMGQVGEACGRSHDFAGLATPAPRQGSCKAARLR